MATLEGPNRQSPIASVKRPRSTLAGHSAGPRGTSTTPTNANRAIRITVQRTQGLRGPNSVFRGRYDRQRTLVIRIAAITLGSDSAIILARFRPSKVASLCPFLILLPVPSKASSATCRWNCVRIRPFPPLWVTRNCLGRAEIHKGRSIPHTLPRGPKDQKISRFRARLKFSSENVIFERATHRGPIFVGKSRCRA